MQRVVYVPTRIRVPYEYLIGEESPGLKAFRRLIPPFIHVEIIEPGTPEYDNLTTQSVSFEAGENLACHVTEFTSRLIDERMGQGSKEFYTSKIGDANTLDADGKKLGIPLFKAIIAEMAENQDPDYIEGVKKVYLIHPSHLEKELKDHVSPLLVPAMAGSMSERLISVDVGQKTRHFVVEPYMMDLTSRPSTNPRWLIVHMYNPDMPALAIGVEAQGPLTFKEPTPLLAETEVAEDWAMNLMRDYLRDSGIQVRCVCHEPNGPKTYPDYRARLDGVPWDFEMTRVVGDILETRHILDKPRDPQKMIHRAVQSPPLGVEDVEAALERAIKSKERKRGSAGTARNLCLVLLNSLDLDIGGQSAVWEGMDLSAFDAVVLVNGYSQPSIEFMKGRFQPVGRLSDSGEASSGSTS